MHRVGLFSAAFVLLAWSDTASAQYVIGQRDSLAVRTDSVFRALDRTAIRIHVIVNPPAGVDPVTLATALNQATRLDRFDYTRVLTGLNHGFNTVALVPVEESGRACSILETVFADLCIADVDDGSGTGTPDGGVTIDDLLYYLQQFEAGHASADVDDGSGTGTPDGGVTIDDLLYYLLRFEQGC